MATEYRLSYTASEINNKLSKIDNLASKGEIPTKTSDLTNDSGFITGYTETDPTVPAWAKASTKPTYTASEVGAVAYTAQTLTEAQKSQARANIGFPEITAVDAGKFLRVSVDGKWIVETVLSAEEVSF